MRRPSPLASFGFAALVGAGLGAAALTMLPRGSQDDASAGTGTAGDAGGAGLPSDAALPLPEGVPTADAHRAHALLVAAAMRGFADGRWRITEPMWTRERQFARDPRQPDVCQIRLPERPDAVLPAACADLTRHLLGDVEQFLRAYPLAAASQVEGQGDETVVRFRWSKAGTPEGPTREATFRVRTGELLAMFDRDGAGRTLRALELVERGTSGWTPRPVPVRVVATTADPSPEGFAAFAARVPVPIYEPSTLPPRFKRSGYGYDDRAPRGDASGEPLPLAWVAYTDGLVRMNLFVARRADMRRLEALAREQQTAAGGSTCPTSSADTPEEMLAEADAILVHRRDDGCRVVLRRDDLPEVAVALVGFRGLPAEDYVRTVRSLVRVGATRPGEVPLHDAAEPRGR